MDLDQIKAEAEKIEQKAAGDIMGISRRRLYCYAAMILLVVIYFGWCKWGDRPLKPENGFVATKPAVTADKVAGPTVALKIVPKAAVSARFPAAHIKPADVIVDTAKIPMLINGGIAIVTVDETTGEASTQIQASPAPWFAFERNNTAGAGVEIGTEGQRVPIYYRRDLVRIKDIHLLAEVGGKVALNGGRSEAHAGALIEYRW